jgi:hypothetical protein
LTGLGFLNIAKLLIHFGDKMTEFEINLITAASVLSIISLTVKLCMTALKTDFLHSGQNTLTLFILPQAAFIVVTAVSGNLVLSLGLVGALSVVRFRNPVLSSMELFIYFLTIGVSYNSSRTEPLVLS